jgi:hypothetical protein
MDLDSPCRQQGLVQQCFNVSKDKILICGCIWATDHPELRIHPSRGSHPSHRSSRTEGPFESRISSEPQIIPIHRSSRAEGAFRVDDPFLAEGAFRAKNTIRAEDLIQAIDHPKPMIHSEPKVHSEPRKPSELRINLSQGCIQSQWSNPIEA